MDNAQKAIMIGVGLFITIIIIAAVMLITGMGQDMLQSGQQQVTNISASLQAQLTADFDGTTVTGAQVITAVKRYYQDDTMIIKVKATANGATKDYGKIVAGGSFDASNYTVESVASNNNVTKVGTLTDTSASNTDNYVPNSAKYKANIIKIKGSNDVVGIIFERQ